MDSSSRFANAEPILVGNKATFGRWARPSFMYESNLNEDQIIKVSIDQSNAGRPDLIANEYYGSDRLEWIVVLFNRPLEPIGWPKTGTVIHIPSKNVIFTNQQ